MNLLAKRLALERTSAYKNPEESFILFCNEDNLKDWSAYLFGPEGTSFEAGIFKISIKINDVHYPNCL
jgi:peroxin-4